MAVRIKKDVTDTCPLGHRNEVPPGDKGLIQGGPCHTCGNMLADFIKMGLDQARTGAAGPFEQEWAHGPSFWVGNRPLSKPPDPGSLNPGPPGPPFPDLTPWTRSGAKRPFRDCVWLAHLLQPIR